MYGSILYLFYSRSWAELCPEISDRLINYHRTSRTRTIRKFITRSKYLFFLPHLPFTLHNRAITLFIHSSLHHQPTTLFVILHSRPSLPLPRLMVSFKSGTQVDGDRDAHLIFPCQTSHSHYQQALKKPTRFMSVHTMQQGAFPAKSRIRHSYSLSRSSNLPISIERFCI